MQKKKLIEYRSLYQRKKKQIIFCSLEMQEPENLQRKAILNEYYGQGLRMIKVYKHQFKALSEVLEQIKETVTTSLLSIWMTFLLKV